jgi:PAS domain S-box-containing protein
VICVTEQKDGPSWTEVERLTALARYAILDTPPEQDFDDLARLASELLGTPIALVNLIGEGRQWFKAEIGMGVREMPLDSICSRIMLQPDELVVPDLLDDPRFNGNPLVTSAPGLRFYAGELLRTPEGIPLGTLCVLDTEPRPEGLSAHQRFVLKTLARQVMGQLELRRTVAGRDTALAAQNGAVALHRQILNSPPDLAIIATDLDGRVTQWNAGAENVLGWTEAEMLGQTAERLFTPEDRAANRMRVEMRCARDTGRGNNERWLLRKDGQRFWASGAMTPLKTEAGDLVGYVKVLRNRTEQHEAVAALDAVAERYRLASRATNDAVWDWDLRNNTVLWNEAQETAYGHTPALAEPTGEWWLAQIHPGDRARVSGSIHAVIDGSGEHWTDEYRFRRADGSYAEVLDRGYVLRGHDGKAIRMIGAMLDLSERNRVAAELRRSEDRYQALFNSIDEGFCIIEMLFDGEKPVDYRFLEVNAAFERQTGLADVIGRTVRSFAPTHEQHWFDIYGRVALTGEPVRFENSAEALDDRWYDVYAFRVDAPEARRVAVLFNDVSVVQQARLALARSRDELEREVQERTAALERTLKELRAESAERVATEERLRQSQKMEAVGQLTGGLAHDFNNLLTGISGSLEILDTRVAQGRYKELDRFVGAAQSAAKRAAALTHRLLAFARQQTLDPRATDTNRLVAGMEELIRRTIGPAIELEVVAAGALWPTLVDANQLENVLLNFCINARDAMPDGGRLTIETGNKWLDVRTAREQDMPPGQYVAVSVTDTGTGMPAEIIAKAFDPFFTTKPLGQGTGLGLSMAYGFARQSGGQVRIYSEIGQGTTMRLYLPRHFGETEEAGAALDFSEVPRAQAGETVLVVDDEPTIRMLAMEVLEELGYEAIEAADGASGLGVLQSNARVDLLITDVGLPGGMSGRQMADLARVNRPDLKVLFITGYAENSVVGNGHLEPGMHVMTKPFALDALASRIKELIEGG